MDNSVKLTDTPQISEENWLRHFQSVHSAKRYEGFTKTRRQQNTITSLELLHHRNRNTYSSKKKIEE